MEQRIKAPRRSTISPAELEAVLWRHRLKFRADYIRDDTPFWKRYIFEILAANLSTEQKLLNIVLCVHADGDTGENARPCLDRIQALSGLTRPTIVKHLNPENQWVVKTQTGAGRATNTYSIVIPQQTIDEIVALYGESSGKAALPLQPSGKRALPLADAVAVNGVNHYGAEAPRSGKNGRRSGKAALPDTIYTENLSKEREPKKKREGSSKGTFLPKELTLPPHWRDKARASGLAEACINPLAKKFHRHYTSKNVPHYKKQFLDWDEKWEEWVERELEKRPSYTLSSRSSWHVPDDGMDRG
jgi:hypothetical protein